MYINRQSARLPYSDIIYSKRCVLAKKVMGGKKTANPLEIMC